MDNVLYYSVQFGNILLDVCSTSALKPCRLVRYTTVLPSGRLSWLHISFQRTLHNCLFL